MRLVDRGGYYVAETAVVVGDVRCGKGSSIWFGAVVRGDLARITIGRMTNIQDLVVVHTDPDKDLVIGSNVTVGHHAVVHGSRVGDQCLIGIGAILLGGSVVGKGSVIGAGAVVREGQIIPPRSLVVGVPARVIGVVGPKELRSHLARARRYYRLARRYLRRK